MNIKHTVKERFLKYVTIDTESDAKSPTCPSTPKQKNLGKLLVNQLLEMGVEDAHMDEDGYVYATIPATTDKQVPVICFCSHMDTSPDCSGKDVKPIVHENYQGKDIVLPDDTSQVLRLSQHKELKNSIGKDIVTASGLTLLGADNKAGVSEIMDAANHLMNNPDLKHGTIKILFTPDEEIGRGADRVDIKKLGADFGYTIDGETIGTMENETFSADGVKIEIQGLSVHPGFAKGKLESAIKIAADIVATLPKDRLSPETTSGKEGFIHPVGIEGKAENATIGFIIRDFEEEGLVEKEAYLKELMDNVLKQYPNSSATFTVKKQYRNMRDILEKNPEIVANAMEALRRSGFEPKLGSIRGGTDGSRLSFMGLPCPNIFTGGHGYHSRQEWVAVQDMEKAVETIVNLCLIWAE